MAYLPDHTQNTQMQVRMRKRKREKRKKNNLLSVQVQLIEALPCDAMTLKVSRSLSFSPVRPVCSLARRGYNLYHLVVSPINIFTVINRLAHLRKERHAHMHAIDRCQ